MRPAQGIEEVVSSVPLEAGDANQLAGAEFHAQRLALGLEDKVSDTEYDITNALIGKLHGVTGVFSYLIRSRHHV
jgi:hypothetical protein